MKNSKFRLYGLATYDRSAKVRWLLTEMGIDFEMKYLNREKKEHETPAFLKLNPMGRIPVLEFNDQAMLESGAICEYLADLFGEKGMAPASDSPHRVKYLQWMYFASATIDVYQIRVMIIEDIPPGEVLNTKLTALQSDLRDALTTLNETFAKASYLVADRFSAADIAVSYHLAWLKLWPELDSVFTDFPRVNTYLDRMKAMPSAIKAYVFSYKG